MNEPTPTTTSPIIAPNVGTEALLVSTVYLVSRLVKLDTETEAQWLEIETLKLKIVAQSGEIELLKLQIKQAENKVELESILPKM